MAKNSEASLLLRIKQVGGEVLEQTGDLLKGLGKLGAVAFGEVTAAVTLAVKSYREQEDATNRLNQTLIQQGIYTTEVSRQYQEMAAQFQKVSTYGDETIISAEAQIQANIGQTKVTHDLMQATLDLATAKKMDLASAAEMVSKTIGTSTNALARQGIQIDTNLPKTQKMAEVIRQLEARFGGQAEAATEGLGALDKMKNVLSDFLENAGARFAPVIISWADAISEMADQVNQNSAVFDGLSTVFVLVAKSAVIAKDVVIGLTEAISGGLGTAVGAIVQMINGDFTVAWETLKDGAGANADAIAARYTQLQKELADIDQAILDGKTQAQENEIEMINAANERKIEIDQANAQVNAESFQIRSQEELATLQAQEDLKKDVAFQNLDQRYKKETDFTEKLKLEMQKRKMLEEAKENAKVELLTGTDKFEAMLETDKVKRFEKGMDAIANVQHSKNKEMAAVGKAAAMVSIGFDTARGAIAAYSSLAGIPLVGPALGAIAAGVVIAYGAEQMSNVQGIALAEGGIVPATPGGVPAIIGEGGRDEAVIPLEDGRVPGMGNTIQIVVYGGLLGDDNQAREFALAVDRELLKLRRSNESVSFDEAVT